MTACPACGAETTDPPGTLCGSCLAEDALNRATDEAVVERWAFEVEFARGIFPPPDDSVPW